MTESTSSEQQELLIAGYVLQNLSPEEADAFEQLMVNNPAVAEEVEQLQASLEVVYTPSPVQPPAHLRASVVQAFQDAASGSGQKPTPSVHALSSHPVRRNRRQPWLMAWGAIAAVLILVLGVNNLRLWKKVQTIQTQRQPSDVLTVSLQPPAEDSSTAVTVMIDPTSLEATLRLNNLPPLPAGQVYVLWTVLQPNAPFTTDDKNAILTTVFTTDGPDQSEAIALPPVYREQQWIKAIAITIEAANAPQHHVSSPILIEAL